MVSEELKKSALLTLALFAAQDQAPTLLELRQLLLRASEHQQQPGLRELREVLEGDLADKVVSRCGLYCLRGFEKTVEVRREKYIYTSHLLKKARIWAAGLRHLPYVRAAAVSGSSAQMNARKDSDIDLFIIAAPGRVFTARFFVSAYFHLLGMRRYGKNITSRFCLNHYVTDGTRLDTDHTVYTALLYTSFFTVFGERHVEDFWRKNLDWMKDYIIAPSLPSSQAFLNSKKERSPATIFFELALFPFAALLEKFLGFLQRHRIHQSEYVVVSESELAFHPDSKGQKILARYREIVESLG